MDVKDFYARNLYMTPDYAIGECLNIPVSVDGSYSHIGRNSSGGVTFIFEIITGRLIDFEYTEKCFDCKLSEKFSDNGNCPNNKFHGSSGNMEVYNAMILFKRSEQWGFRYTTIISDGDNKVYPKLRDANIYPNIKILKCECANHLQKKVSKEFDKIWGNVYWGEGHTRNR